MYQLSKLQDVALNLTSMLAAPQGAVSISSFLRPAGDTILVVHINPRFRYLSSKVPRELMGVPIEYDIVDYPKMN